MSKNDEKGRVSKDKPLTHEKQIAMATALQEQGHTVKKIAYVMRINESVVRVLLSNPQANLWYPEDEYYKPRPDDKYGMPIVEIEDPGEIIFLVRKRVDKDLELAAITGYLGEDKAVMRDVMMYVINELHILNLLHSIAEDGKEAERTVDSVCRELGKNSRELIP